MERNQRAMPSRLEISRRDRRERRFGVRRLAAAFSGVGLPAPLKQPFRSGFLFSSYEILFVGLR